LPDYFGACEQNVDNLYCSCKERIKCWALYVGIRKAFEVDLTVKKIYPKGILVV